MIFLLGRQAMFGQEPPTYFRSITTARFPSLANVQARYLPASPLPSTTWSYFSGLEIWSFIWIEVVGSNVRKLLSPWREISPAGSGLPNETQNKSIRSAKPAQERELQPFFWAGFGANHFSLFCASATYRRSSALAGLSCLTFSHSALASFVFPIESKACAYSAW